MMATLGLTLADRGMSQPTTMGLAIPRVDLGSVLAAAARTVPHRGVAVLLFHR